MDQERTGSPILCLAHFALDTCHGDPVGCCLPVGHDPPGGYDQDRGWYLLQLVPPLLGLLTLIVVVLVAIVRRRLSRAVVITGLVSLLAILPALLLVAPVVAYPASITSMTPSATVRLPANVL